MPTGPTEADPSLDVVTEAELFTVPQVAVVVGEVMWTLALAPEARLNDEPPQVRTPEEIAQLHPPLVLAMDQLSPALVGRVSVMVTPLAVPAPVLDTVTTYPIGSPALTQEASATLVMWMEAQFTVIGTGPTEADPSLEVVTEAELFTVPQVAEVVGEVMW